MAYWVPRAGWMDFQLDDMAAELSGAYTIAWKITDDDGSEKWSSRFAALKQKQKPPTYGALALLKGALPGLFSTIGLDPSEAVFIPALSSSETIANEKGQLAYLARNCANAMGAGFVCEAVTKQVHNPIHGIYNLDGRRAELAKANYQASPIKTKSIVIFDDFITAGSTLSRIAQAVRESTPKAKVYGVALGKAERRRWMPDISNDHVLAKWDNLWAEGEKRN